MPKENDTRIGGLTYSPEGVNVNPPANKNVRPEIAPKAPPAPPQPPNSGPHHSSEVTKK